jgi:DNA-binding LacI/PurR family transcriptional regulator
MTRVTIADVATHAGVSTGTVSAVLNGRASVRPQTRQRVVDSIAELGYRPSDAARRLAAGGKDVADRAICLIVKEFDNPFYSPVILGVQEVVERAGYHLFVANSYGEFEKEKALISVLANPLIAGAIIAPVMHDHADRSHLYALRQVNFPFVLLERLPGLDVCSVSIDNEAAMEAAVSHLIALGHRQIVHISGPPHTFHTNERIHGVRRAFSKSPLVYADACVVEGGTSLRDGYEAARALFQSCDSDRRPTGISCFNDLVAIGAIRALNELGLGVPDDVSVVGCDDIDIVEFLPQGITTVHSSKFDIGRQAAGLLIETLKEGPGSRSTHVRLESRVVVRSTTRAPESAVAVT